MTKQDMARHDWILEVLVDLRDYAEANQMPALAQQVEVAIEVARGEIPSALSGLGQARRH